MFSCAVSTAVMGRDRRRTKYSTTRPVSRAEMTVPSRTPMICPRNSSRDSPAASATQPTSKAIFTLPGLWPVRSDTALTKASPEFMTMSAITARDTPKSMMAVPARVMAAWTG